MPCLPTVHVRASLRDISLTLAMYSHVTALAMVASKSLASRRLRLSHAKVRSTTQRRGSITKPFAASDRLMISMVQSPNFASAPCSLSPANAADIHVTPDGRFVYASERQTSTLTGFRVDAVNGLLLPIGRWPTETTPRVFAVDPRGRFLLAAGLDSNGLSVHAIDPQDGTLSVRARVQVGAMPNWVEVVDLG